LVLTHKRREILGFSYEFMPNFI